MRPQPRKDYLSSKSGDATWAVWRYTAESDFGPCGNVSIRHGAFHFQDAITPSDMFRLADALIACAHAVRAEQQAQKLAGVAQ